MTRVNGFERLFWEKYEDCDLEKTSQCDQMNCICGRTQRRAWFTNQLEKHFEGAPYYFITICPPNRILKYGELAEFDVSAPKDWMRKEIKGLKVRGLKSIFFLDIMLLDVIDKTRNRNPEWHIHFHGIIAFDLDLPDAKRLFYYSINKIYGAGSILIKEVTVKPFNVGYMIKFVDEHKRKLQVGIRGQGKSHKRIKGKYKKELNSFYEGNKLCDLILLMGMRRRSDSLIVIKYNNRCSSKNKE